MSRSTKFLSRGAALGVTAVVLFTVLPTTVAAQASVDPMIVASERAVDMGEADEARQKADALLATQEVTKWKKAASLLEDAASLRPVESPTAIEEWALSAEMFYNLGQLDRSQKNLQRAAEQALSNGRVLEAAQLFLKASYVADARRHGLEATAFLQNAKRLAASPHLTQAECDCIRDRIVRVTNPEQKVAKR